MYAGSTPAAAESPRATRHRIIITMQDSEITGQFDDIRPYHDGEVAAVMARLMADREMADTILSMMYPRAARYLGWALRPLVRRRLRREFGAIRTVREFQLLIGHQLEALLPRCNTRFTVSGLELSVPQRTVLSLRNP